MASDSACLLMQIRCEWIYVVRFLCSRIYPLDLELDFFFAVRSFMLDGKFCLDRHVDALTGDLDFKLLTIFNGVGQAAQLGDKLGIGIAAFDVSLGFAAHLMLLSLV